jgi:hypothetical protein
VLAINDCAKVWEHVENSFDTLIFDATPLMSFRHVKGGNNFFKVAALMAVQSCHL